MTEKATCSTCPWFYDGGPSSAFRCRHVANRDVEASAWGIVGRDEWCSEHPDLKLPGVHELAARFRAEMIHETDSTAPYSVMARDAYNMADAMLAEANRRRGE